MFLKMQMLRIYERLDIEFACKDQCERSFTCNFYPHFSYFPEKYATFSACTEADSRGLSVLTYNLAVHLCLRPQ